MDLTEAISVSAPIYNLVLVAVLVVLFIRLFRTQPRISGVFMKPWKVMFMVICVYILEEVTTVLRGTGAINVTVYINGFFELIIVSLITYLLMLQREYWKKTSVVSSTIQ
jgi:heme A synthase